MLRDNIKKLIAALIVFSTSMVAVAADHHAQLASQFDELTSSSDYSSEVSAYLELLKQYIPFDLDGQDEKKITEFIINVLTSREYKDIKVKIYKEMYAEAELEQLIDLVQQPAFKILNDRRNEMIKKVSQATGPLMRQRLQEFTDELKEEKQSGDND